MPTATNEEKYIPTRDAAHAADLHPDYVARLAREGKIRAKRLGRKWHVETDSLTAFVRAQAGETARRNEELKHKRVHEYRKSKMPRQEGLSSQIIAPEAREAIADAVRVPSAYIHEATTQVVARGGIISTPGLSSHMLSPAIIHPVVDFLHKIVALVASLILVFGAYSYADPHFRAVACVSLLRISEGAFGGIASMDGNSGTISQVAAASQAFMHRGRKICGI